MRHRRIAKKFGRSKAHRERLLGTLVAHLIRQGRIQTTLPKAKATRRDAEKMVTLARKGTLAARRLAAARLRSPSAVADLFEKVVPALAGRNGGYTRIAKLGQRASDGSNMAIIEWVTFVAPAAAPAADAAHAATTASDGPKKDGKAQKAAGQPA